jgi:hypothetical protein
LFGCASCRSVWAALTDTRCRTAVEISEQFADGMASKRELLDAHRVAVAAFREVCHEVSGPGFLRRMAADAAATVSNPMVSKAGLAFLCSVQLTQEFALLNPTRWRGVCLQLRDIFGNPFRPSRLDRAWLAWNERTVQQMAQAIYDERAYDRLPLLADALEDAGCTDAAILDHCRGPGQHVRGCWVVDLLRGQA